MGLLSGILRIFGHRLSTEEELELRRDEIRKKADHAQAQREAAEDRRFLAWLRQNVKRGRKY